MYLIKAESFIRKWQWFMIGLIGLSVVLFIIELSFDLNEGTLHIIELIDLVVIGVFAAELLVHFIFAKDKKQFFRENWLMILAVLPLMRLGRFFRLLPEIAGSEMILMPGIVKIINPRTLSMAQKGVKAKHHMKMVKKSGEKNRIAAYVGPHVDKKLSEGILNGVNLFLKEQGYDTEIDMRKYRHVFRLEQGLIAKSYRGEIVGKDVMRELFSLPRDSIVITDGKYALDNPYNQFGQIKNIGGKMIGLFNGGVVMEQGTEYKMDSDYLMNLRGMVIGYNTAARAFSDKCFNEDCIYSDLTADNLDKHAFRMHIKKDWPKCDRH